MAARKKKATDDLLDTKPSKKPAKVAPQVKDLKAGLVEQRGEVALYDRTKCEPCDPKTKPEMRWVIVAPAGCTFYPKKKASRAALRQMARKDGGSTAAPRTRKPRVKDVTEVDLENVSDPDVHRASERGEGLPDVPTCWMTEEGRVGLLVHYSKGIGKIISLVYGDGYTVRKVGREALFASQQAAQAHYTHKAAEWSTTHRDGKPMPYDAGDAWWPISSTARQFASVFERSTLPKTRATLEFMAALDTGAGKPASDATADDLLALEEDLLA